MYNFTSMLRRIEKDKAISEKDKAISEKDQEIARLKQLLKESGK